MPQALGRFVGFVVVLAVAMPIYFCLLESQHDEDNNSMLYLSQSAADNYW